MIKKNSHISLKTQIKQAVAAIRCLEKQNMILMRHNIEFMKIITAAIDNGYVVPSKLNKRSRYLSRELSASL